MEEKDKLRAELESKITRYNATIDEIRMKREMRNDTIADASFNSALRKYGAAKTAVSRLDGSDENTDEKIRTEVENLLEGIDADLRQAMTQLGA